MSANFEQSNDRLLVLRVGGELKKSELDVAQSEFVKKIVGAGTVKLLVLLENFSGWERGEQWGDTLGRQVLAFTGAGLRKGPVKFFPETSESDARAWLAE